MSLNSPAAIVRKYAAVVRRRLRDSRRIDRAYRRRVGARLFLFLKKPGKPFKGLVAGAVDLVHGVVGNGIGLGDHTVFSVVLYCLRKGF